MKQDIITILKQEEFALKKFVLMYDVYVDTSALLGGVEMEMFFKRIVPFLKVSNRQIFIPKSVVFELERLENYGYKKAVAAKKARNLLADLLKEGVVAFVSIEGRNYKVQTADEELLGLFWLNRSRKSLLLITSDKTLAKEVLLLNFSRAVKSKNKIKVKRINSAGYLSNIFKKVSDKMA